MPKQPTETRQASLVAAALALAAERSPAHVTTADLAQAIELSRRTLALTTKLSPSAPAATSGTGPAGPPKGAEPSR